MVVLAQEGTALQRLLPLFEFISYKGVELSAAIRDRQKSALGIRILWNQEFGSLARRSPPIFEAPKIQATTMATPRSETTAAETEQQVFVATRQEESESLMSRKRPRLEKKTPKDEPFHTPAVLARGITHNDAAIEEAYLKCQVVHIPTITTSVDNNLTWKDVGSLFESLTEDKESWCVENGGKAVEASDFLRAKHTGYSSFLLQKDKGALRDALQRLPIQELHSKWSYGPCVWFFFGVNPEQHGGEDLQGRPEHTDSVSHDGTWHYQLSGTKRWYLRPTDELLKTCPEATSAIIDCEEGGVILVNTRLWWHRTSIPPQPTPSVSYARDFYMKATALEEDTQEPMSNVDGLYAANNVEEGTILFTEHDMPDCELPHSCTNANCKVVELEDGSSALVSTRLISAGEFFCVAEDSDEEESEVEEEECEEDTDE